MNITKNLKISSIFMTSVLVSTVLCISLLYPVGEPQFSSSNTYWYAAQYGHVFAGRNFRCSGLCFIQ